MTYEIDIAGLKRELPLCKVSDDLYIGAFVMFGDVELTVHCATELLKRAPEYDYLLAPEAKSIPLLYEMARQSGADEYFLARKGPKAYMSGVFEVNVKSITTMGVRHRHRRRGEDQGQAHPDPGRRDLHRRVPARHRGAGQTGRRHRGRQDGRPGRG